MNHSFPKSEKLCGEIRIKQLFTTGQAFIAYPLRVCYVVTEAAEVPAVEVMVSVPKRLFKRAVKRNRLKRLMRESYRLNKAPFYGLCDEKGVSLQIAFSYIGKEMADFETVQKAVRKASERLTQRLTPETEPLA